jgi:hypothetical protein
VESDVTTTLSELERKLKELERELESVGRAGELDSDPAQAGWTPGTPAGAPGPAAGPVRGPPPAGATPFTAAWHGSGPAAAPPPPPPASPYNGAPPVAVTPPPAPWPVAAPPPPAAPAPRAAPPQAAPPQAARPPQAPAAPPQAAAPPPAQAPPPPIAAVPPPPAAPGLHRQLDELLAFRDRLVQTTDDLVAELSRVLTELGADVSDDPADTVLSGRVVVEAAPFADLATLSAFEAALVRTPGVAEVYVRALDAGRATIDVQLAGPMPLAAALRPSVPVGLAVAEVGEGRLVLALGPPGS